ncbi:MAG: DNA lyase [Sphaerochaetaceae bacterium]|nr:DNA lyase [Sphaerochaetaceae bacterium]
MIIDKNTLSLEDTLFSGQCFRVLKNPDNPDDPLFTVYSGVGENVREFSLRQSELDTDSLDPYWHNFFDMDTDYESLKKSFSETSDIMKQACAFAPGIRILNQDPWEALCSFVVSQNNNIKRIMGIIDRMCTFFGSGEVIHGFPTPEQLVDLSEEQLRAVGLGFRAPYIKNTARAVLDGKINFDEMKSLPIDECRRILMQVKGIGIKVADCALLFGMHRLDCYPMDVWMKRVMAECYGWNEKTDCACEAVRLFGPCAGVAQQYLFHWARNGGPGQKV